MPQAGIFQILNGDGRIDVRRVGIFLCGITAAICMTGCGSIMPDLTEEETEIISEYASGVLLKYDRVYRSRLMDMSEYEARSRWDRRRQP